MPELFAGNTLHFHAVIVAAGRQQIQNLIAAELPALTPAESAEFLVNHFLHQEDADRRFAQPAVQHLLRDDTSTRRTLVELAAGIPLLLQMLADLVADDPYRPLVSPDAPVPEGSQARIDYVLQHYVERLALEAPDDADRAQRRRLLLYSAVPRRIPNDGLLHALFHDLPGAAAPGRS